MQAPLDNRGCREDVVLTVDVPHEARDEGWRERKLRVHPIRRDVDLTMRLRHLGGVRESGSGDDIRRCRARRNGTAEGRGR